MREILIRPNFAEWRKEARILLENGISPPEVLWKSTQEDQEELAGLFARNPEAPPIASPSRTPRYTVPSTFVQMAKFISAHRDPARWALLYRVLWRLTHGEPELLNISVDTEVVRWNSMYRSVRRDMHKMKAFVRFRETRDADSGEAHFVAWYEPDHLIVRLMGSFFAERFQGMHWSILTADDCAHWDKLKLHYSVGVPRSMAPLKDDVEALWKTYYASTFNPARIKVQAMRKELPVRYWKNLPEAQLISGLIQNAPSRLQSFYRDQPRRAEEWLPARGPNTRTLESLRQAASQCRACSICENATQTVFGEGPLSARIVIIGEQPGDQEDRVGRPFQGPAGQLLDQALLEAGLKREELYLTNAVKHFKWKPQGKVRLHQRPASSEIAACKPWLAAEIELLKPEVIICLGVSAAQAVFGKTVTLKELRGRVHATGACDRTWVTTHPSAILRTPGEVERNQEYARFVEDLKAAGFLSKP